MTERKVWTRAKGDRRKTAVVRTRVPESFADAIDEACLSLNLPRAEFVRRCLEQAVNALARAKGGAG